jgi:hypothetical protein
MLPTIVEKNRFRFQYFRTGSRTLARDKKTENLDKLFTEFCGNSVEQTKRILKEG